MLEPDIKAALLSAYKATGKANSLVAACVNADAKTASMGTVGSLATEAVDDAKVALGECHGRLLSFLSAEL